MNNIKKERIAKKALRAFYKDKYIEISNSLETMADSYLKIIGGLYAKSIQNYQAIQELNKSPASPESYNLEA